MKQFHLNIKILFQSNLHKPNISCFINMRCMFRKVSSCVHCYVLLKVSKNVPILYWNLFSSNTWNKPVLFKLIHSCVGNFCFWYLRIKFVWSLLRETSLNTLKRLIPAGWPLEPLYCRKVSTTLVKCSSNLTSIWIRYYFIMLDLVSPDWSRRMLQNFLLRHWW